MSFEIALKTKTMRKTPVSWDNLVRNILDQYYLYVGDISHAVQKDAIQNSWDARGNDVSKWGMAFSFIEDSKGKKMLIMQDFGTTGLTGKILPTEEYDHDLSEEERWGRFQGLAFRRESSKVLGARGQGKFVFVGASNNSTIVYDTLRADGVYRLGVRRLGDILELEGKEAVDLLKAYSPDLQPLSMIGSRVIIDEPVPELERALKTWKFMRYIQTTWWPLLSEYNAQIQVKVHEKESKVFLPKDLIFPSLDTQDLKVWSKDRLPLDRKTSKGVMLNKLRFCWNKEQVAEDIRGIAIIRGGMVVERIPIPDLLPSADPDLSKRIYGYVEGDMGVELLLKKTEDPTHYRFGKRAGWGRKNIYGVIKDIVSGQLQLFASEKLGAEKGKTEEKDYQTIKQFNSIVKAVGISLEHLSSGGGGGGGGPIPRKNEISLSFPFPKSKITRRFEFDEELGGFFLTVNNETRHKATFMVKIETMQETLIREKILMKSYPPIRGHGGKVRDGPFVLRIDKSKYTEGKCQLRARLINLEHQDYIKGYELDQVIHVFWIAQDPPLSNGPFREIKRSPTVIEELDNKAINVDGKVVPHPGGGYDLIMNIGHPLYKEKCKIKENEPQYEIELMAKKLPFVLLEENVPPFEGINEPSDILKLSNITYSQIMEKYFKF